MAHKPLEAVLFLPGQLLVGCREQFIQSVISQRHCHIINRRNVFVGKLGNHVAGGEALFDILLRLFKGEQRFPQISETLLVFPISVESQSVVEIEDPQVVQETADFVFDVLVGELAVLDVGLPNKSESFGLFPVDVQIQRNVF